MIVPARWDVPEPIVEFEVRATDGFPISVRRHGTPDGPRLVLSHGNGFSIDSYYPFWSRLTDRFDLFIYDLRSHGWNPVGDRRTHNVPTFVSDSEFIVRDIDRRFGTKPLIGLFHSLSSLVALRQAAAEDSFSALVLFDPPVFPPGGFPHDMEHIGQRLGEIARKRRNWFETPEHFAEQLTSKHVFERVCPGGVDLFARTTLRRCADGRGYELRCPREYEAQINEYVFCWSMTVDLESVHCPIKAIGADPTLPHSYMPSMDLGSLLLVDYDFVPETTHFLQIEEPEVCAALALEFLEEHRLV